MTFKPFLAAIALGVLAAPAQAHTCGAATQIAAHHTAAQPASDIVATAAAAGQFQTLLAAAQAAGLADALAGPGPLTVFAPTDAAFAALPAGALDRLLLPQNRHLLADVLKYHVVPGRVTSDQLAGRTLSADTLNGSVLIDATRGVRVGNAMVTTADIATSNGVIHVIDRVLLPPGLV